MCDLLHISTFETKSNFERSEHRDTILWILQRLAVELTLSSQNDESKQILTEDQFRISTSLLLNCVITGLNVSELSNPLSLRVKDALPLSRAFYEGCLQAVFVLTDNGALARRAELYSIYKHFRTQKLYYDFSSKKGVIEHPVKLDRRHPLVAESLKLFETNGSKTVRRCFQETRADMIKAIRATSPKSAISFEGAEKMSWEDSSEIAHGSYYSFHSILRGNGISPEEERLEEIAFKSTCAIAMSAYAVAEMIMTIFPSNFHATHLHKACTLFYEFEVPEFFAKLEH